MFVLLIKDRLLYVNSYSSYCYGTAKKKTYFLLYITSVITTINMLSLVSLISKKIEDNKTKISCLVTWIPEGTNTNCPEEFSHSIELLVH